MKPVFLFLKLCLLLVFFQVSNANTTSNQWVQQHWGEDHGLPAGDLNGIVQDNAGFIWLATLDGLVQFDGAEFNLFNSSNSPIPNNRLTTIRKTDKDVLWLTSDERHLIRYSNKKIQPMTVENGMPHSEVVRVTPIGDYGIAYGTINGAILINETDLISLPLNKVFGETHAIHWFNKDLLWVATDAWLFRIENPTGKIKVNKWPLEQEVHTLTTYQNNLWLGTDTGVYQFDGNEIKQQYTQQFKGYVPVLRTDANGSLLISNQDKLFKVSNNDVRIVSDLTSGSFRSRLFNKDKNEKIIYHGHKSLFSEKGVLLDLETEITDFIIDHNSDIWATSSKKGLYHLKRSLIKSIGLEEGLSDENLYPVFQSNNQNIWVRSNNFNAFQLDKTGRLIRIYDDQKHHSVAEIDNKLWLVGFETCEIDRLNQCKAKDLVNNDNKGQFKFIFQDQKDRVWLASRLGHMWLREKNHWMELSKKLHNWDISTRIQTVLETKDGSIWFGTNGDGLIRFKNGRVNKDYINWGLKSNQIRSLLMLENDQLLVGTQDQGLCIIKINTAQSARCISQQQNLKSLSIHFMHRDQLDRIWWSSNIGVFWQPLETLLAVLNNEINVLPLGGQYDTRNGMRNAEANGGVYPSGMVDKNNQMWIPTQKGLAIFDLSDTHTIPKTKAIIQSISSKNTNYPIVSEQVRFEKNQRSFQIKLTALSYYDPSKIEFRYRLNQQSNGWVELGKNRTVSISNLSHGNHAFEFSARNKDGQWQNSPTQLAITIAPFWYETRLFFLLSLFVILLAIIGIVMLMNRHLRQRATKLEQLVATRTEELKQMGDKKSEFFANISHELRTPLTLILGPVDDAITSDEGMNKSDLKLVHNSAQRMKRLVDQMLDLQKIDASKLQLTQKQHELIPFLSSCIEPFKLLAKRLNIKLNLINNCAHSKSNIFVLIDPLQFEKVFGNLLSNAFKFSPKNSEINITVKTIRSKLVSISVLDNGPGLQNDSEEKIFNRFSQENLAYKSSSEGTGIGLALAKEITVLHNGSIIAQNRPEGGACFTVTLPYQTRSIDPELSEKNSLSNSLQEISTIEKYQWLQNKKTPQDPKTFIKHQTKILIVEDNADLQLYIASHLLNHFQLVIADDGQQGLMAARNNLPDIIITDVMMPNMNGFEMAKELRKDPTTNFIPFLFLTARVALEDELEGLSLGADDYINKPFSGSILLARINSILESRERLKNSLTKKQDAVNNITKDSSLLDQATTKILANISDADFGVQALADALFMSRSKLHRQLKSQNQINASDLLRSIRMKKADELLRNNSGNVSEVCCAVGYTSVSSFSNSYKDTFGISPSSR